MFPATRTVEGQVYVPGIDGLRAIAVLAVVVYHLASRIVPGGFLGVDVFFVISGYVVTGSMLRDARQPLPAFLAAFYARRFRRILPALLACLLATAVADIAFIPEGFGWRVDPGDRARRILRRQQLRARDVG